MITQARSPLFRGQRRPTRSIRDTEYYTTDLGGSRFERQPRETDTRRRTDHFSNTYSRPNNYVDTGVYLSLLTVQVSYNQFWGVL